MRPHPWDSPGKNTGVGCHFLLKSIKVNSESDVTQSCMTLCNPMDCSPPGSSVHGIFQARVLEWGAIAFSTPKMLVTVILVMPWGKQLYVSGLDLEVWRYLFFSLSPCCVAWSYIDPRLGCVNQYPLWKCSVMERYYKWVSLILLFFSWLDLNQPTLGRKGALIWRRKHEEKVCF